MYNANMPKDSELPTTGKLIKSTILAAITASVLLVTVVMPAEYGIDPTGIGKAIGLKKMGEIKVSLAEEAAADRAKIIAANVQAEPVKAEAVIPKAEPTQLSDTTLSHEMQVTLAPDEGTEIKVAMNKGNKVQYTWWTDRGEVSFDVHGDSKAMRINYHSYSKGSGNKKNGIIEAAFDGSHGWYWRNRTSENIIITLQTIGEYTGIKHMK